MYMTVLSMWAEPLSEIMYFTNSLNIPRGELLTMKKATKASDNRYYQARFSAAQKNTEFESREALVATAIENKLMVTTLKDE